jgi:hypothetical protein
MTHASMLIASAFALLAGWLFASGQPAHAGTIWAVAAMVAIEAGRARNVNQQSQGDLE